MARYAINAFIVCLRYLLNVLTHALGKCFDKMQDQFLCVLTALPQGRNQNRKDVQPLRKITAEFAPPDHLCQVAMCRRNQTVVNPMRVTASHPFKLLLLQHTQRLGLKCQRNVSYFIQEQLARRSL